MRSAEPRERARATLDIDRAKRFVLTQTRSYAPQYAHLYFVRLNALRAVAFASGRARFGESVRYAERITEAAESKRDGERVVVVGVVFRDVKGKPSILDQYGEAGDGALIPAVPPRATTPYGEGGYFIEDDNGRTPLNVDSVDKALVETCLVTGFVVTLCGEEDKETGSFKVVEVVPLGLAPQKTLSPLASDKYVCIVSGLSFGDVSAFPLAPELLLEFLRGNSGDDVEESFSASIVQLIVAGNLVTRVENTEHGAAAVLNMHKALNPEEKERAAAPIVEVDRFLSAVASALPVSVMPGDADPVNYLLPQQPIHRCLLPSSSRSANLSRVPNPFECSVDSRVMLGTSGQPVHDFALYSSKSVPTQTETSADDDDSLPLSNGLPSGPTVLDLMETMLKGRHMAPTCPDTLGSYPFYDEDPFIVNETPHVFFAGNQLEYATRMFKSTPSQQPESEDSVEASVRLISVPRFSRNGQAVLLNLRTMECSLREFALTM